LEEAIAAGIVWGNLGRLAPSAGLDRFEGRPGSWLEADLAADPWQELQKPGTATETAAIAISDCSKAPTKSPLVPQSAADQGPAGS
jgi:hypothetical protein